VSAGLILAAGAGTRFGDAPKQLAPLGGRPLLQWAIDAQCAVAALEPVVVVLGARAVEVAAGIDFGRARTVLCADWEAGQSASLRRGLRAMAGADKVVVTLGDTPLISAEVIARFAAEADLSRPTRAVYDGRPGHPVVLGPEEIAALTAIDGDRGARDLLRDARVIEVGHLCSGRDVDTPEDLEELGDEARAVI
jgi:CTP:molybdopterin cytidylyltransferase MocA